ncbi:zinc metalloprotease [Savitreella phatthalungensis]
MDSLLRILGKLESWLDNSVIPWKPLVIGFTLAQFSLEQFLLLRQYRKLQATKVPATLAGEIDQDTFDRSQAYGRAKARFTFVSSTYALAQNLAILYFDALPKLWYWAGKVIGLYAPLRFSGVISQSVVFSFSWLWASTLVNLPTALYMPFVLEEKFGFNKQTFRLFWTDLVKGQLLGLAIGAPILAAFLKIVDYFGKSFFVYLWLFFLGFQVVMITIYPIFIQPLFNKLEPLPEGSLRSSVNALAEKLKFPLKHLYQIDGSKRSAHSNAYFYGLPWAKHIVLFDTLMEHTSEDQIVAVLAHELGHWKLSHTSRLLAISQVHLFAVFALFSAFINNRSVYRSFGFPPGAMPIVVGFFLYNEILQPVDAVLQLAMNMLSRKHEYEADAFAKDLGKGDELCQALVKLQVKNLSTMDPDPWFSAYHHSHPTLTERLRAVGYKAGEKKK